MRPNIDWSARNIKGAQVWQIAKKTNYRKFCLQATICKQTDDYSNDKKSERSERERVKTRKKFWLQNFTSYNLTNVDIIKK